MPGDLYDLLKLHDTIPVDFYLVPYDRFEVTDSIENVRSLAADSAKEFGSVELNWPLSKEELPIVCYEDITSIIELANKIYHPTFSFFMRTMRQAQKIHEVPFPDFPAVYITPNTNLGEYGRYLGNGTILLHPLGCKGEHRNTLAHEIGHGIFGDYHDDNDSVMRDCSTSTTFSPKYQEILKKMKS